MTINFDFDKVKTYVVSLKSDNVVFIHADQVKHDELNRCLWFYIDGMSVSSIDDCYWIDYKEI